MSARKSSRNHPPLLGVHLNELPQNDQGIPLVLEVMCRHLLDTAVVQSEDLFSTEASDGELNKLRKDLEESRGSNVDINKYQATTIASLLVEFFSQLPVPLSAHLSGAFCNALSHEKAALQIAELKALLRQLPDVHRNVLTYMLRFMIEVSTHEHANSASRQTLAEAFATKMFRQHQTDEGEDDEEWDEDDRSPRDKQKLLLLMLSHQPELEGASVRGRATRAGVIPEGTLTVGFSPALSSVQSGGTSTSVGLSTSGTGSSPDKNAKSPQSSGSVVAMRSTAGGSTEAGPHVLEQLPMLLDEGTAAVRQLSDSNEAVTLLVQHLQSQLGTSLFSPEKRAEGELGDVRARVDKCEEAQAATYERLDRVEERLGELPSEADFKSIKAKLADGGEKAADSWQRAVQGRLEEMEERVDNLASPRAGTKGGVSAEEVARMVKTAVDDAFLRSERVREEELKTWREQAEREMVKWRKETEEEIKREAAVAAAQAIKGTLEESKAATKEARAALAALSSSPKEPAESGEHAGGGGGGGKEALEAVERLRKEVQDASSRADNFEERLDDFLKASDAGEDAAKLMKSEVDVLRERVAVLDKSLAKAAKWQDDFVNEPPDLRDVRAKLDVLTKAVEELKPAAAAAPPAAKGPEAEKKEKEGGAGEADSGVAKDVKELRDKLAELQEAVSDGNAARESLGKQVLQVEGQLEGVENMVSVMKDHVETISQASMEAVKGMGDMRKLAAADASSANSEEIIGTILEHLNPEIASLRDAVHALQQCVGEPAAADGCEEDEAATTSSPSQQQPRGGAAALPVLAQLARLWVEVGESPSAARFDALAAQADATQEQVAELHEKLAAMGRERAGSPPPTAADARAAGEVMERVERVEDDVSLLIGARDVTKTALADADKRAAATGAEIRHVDERVGELFDKVEALAAEVLDAKPLREVVEALQTEQEALKKSAQHLKGRLDDLKSRESDAMDKVRALEQKFLKEMEDKDDEIEGIQKALQALTVGGREREAAAACSPSQDLPTKLLSRLVDQVKRLEEIVDTSAVEQQGIAERSRELAQALRKMQVSVDQLEVHRGAVYVSDQALQKLQDEVRRHARTLESVQQQQSKAASAQLGSPDAAHRGGGSLCGGDVADLAATRLREQLNLLRAEMDAGFIKYNNALDSTARTAARAEAQCKSVESLLKQTREELVAEVEQERQRVVDSEVKVRKTADRFKKQLDEALEETRASIEALEQHVADVLAKATRKPDPQRLEPLLERMEVLEEQLQAVQQLAHAAHAAGGGGSGRADVDSTVALVSLRELEGKVSRIENVQASDSRRVGGCEAALTQLQQELLAARAEVRRCADAVVAVSAGGGAAGGSPAARPPSRAQRDRERERETAHEGGGGGHAGAERGKWAQTREQQQLHAHATSSDSADEEAAAVLRESRFRSRASTSFKSSTLPPHHASPASASARASRHEPSRAANGRQSASPTLRRRGSGGASESDDFDDRRLDIRRPASAMRERPRPTAHQPLRATHDGRGPAGGGYAHMRTGVPGGAARGLDRAVERELTQLKRMFGL